MINPFSKEEKKDLTFGGYPVKIKKMHDGDVYIYCKNVIGKWSQIDAFLKKKSVSGIYPYGVREQDKCEIKNSVINPGYLKIACLEGSPDECRVLKKECESLLLT